MDTLKGNPMMEAYLNQQLNAEKENNNPDSQNRDHNIPSNEDLVQFKTFVHSWLQLDEQIKGMKTSIHERITEKKEMTGKILEFMTRYNIEDLNTGRGKLRLKMAVVKEPLSQQSIKEKVSLYFGQSSGGEELNNKIFSERKTYEKPTLKRLGGPSKKVDASKA